VCESELSIKTRFLSMQISVNNMCNLKTWFTSDQPHISSVRGVYIHSLKVDLINMQKIEASTMMEQRVRNALFAMPSLASLQRLVKLMGTGKL
jgi:hypothetical protein